jgi:hypothetical protein
VCDWCTAASGADNVDLARALSGAAAG